TGRPSATLNKVKAEEVHVAATMERRRSSLHQPLRHMTEHCPVSHDKARESDGFLRATPISTLSTIFRSNTIAKGATNRSVSGFGFTVLSTCSGWSSAFAIRSSFQEDRSTSTERTLPNALQTFRNEWRHQSTS